MFEDGTRPSWMPRVRVHARREMTPYNKSKDQIEARSKDCRYTSRRSQVILNLSLAADINC